VPVTKMKKTRAFISRKMGSHVLFSAVCDTSVYLIYRMVVLAPNEYNLRRHYETLRKGTFGVIESKLRENKIRSVKCDLHTHRCILLQIHTLQYI